MTGGGLDSAELMNKAGRAMANGKPQLAKLKPGSKVR